MVTKKLFNSREEWLQGRKNHIGGSDAAACVGLNPYKDNVQLWEEKVGLVLPEDISDKDYVQYGTEAEEYLRALFALDHPEYKVLYACFFRWGASGQYRTSWDPGDQDHKHSSEFPVGEMEGQDPG